jgi:hypothetical protein
MTMGFESAVPESAPYCTYRPTGFSFANRPSASVTSMIASLFRTMGIVPGGLGTFEATSVLMLRMVGIDVAVALSATLLFWGTELLASDAPGILVFPPSAGGTWACVMELD